MKQTGGSAGSPLSPAVAASPLSAKTASSPTSNDDGNTITLIKTAKINYNSYYAQVTPSVGYQPLKQVSIGVGPDFQQMLVDNRPEPSKVDKNNIKEAPLFDVGMMGKVEVAIARNIKAAMYYREGINNVITPSNSFIDRNYVQFQLKYSILNR